MYREESAGSRVVHMVLVHESECIPLVSEELGALGTIVPSMDVTFTGRVDVFTYLSTFVV